MILAKFFVCGTCRHHFMSTQTISTQGATIYLPRCSQLHPLLADGVFCIMSSFNICSSAETQRTRTEQSSAKPKAPESQIEVRQDSDLYQDPISPLVMLRLLMKCLFLFA